MQVVQLENKTGTEIITINMSQVTYIHLLEREVNVYLRGGDTMHWSFDTYETAKMFVVSIGAPTRHLVLPE